MADPKRIAMTLLTLVVSFAGGTAWAEGSNEVEPKETVKSTESDVSEDDGQSTLKIVEYRVPKGGYLTDPAIVQDELKGSSLNRIFPLWKSIAKGHALLRLWSVGVVGYRL